MPHWKTWKRFPENNPSRFPDLSRVLQDVFSGRSHKERQKMDSLRLLFISFFLVVASACAAPMPREDATVAAPGKGTIAKEFLTHKQPTDEALFFQGLSFLSDSLQSNDYSAVKHSLITLINDHPQSKWRDNAYMLLRLTEDLESYRDKLHAEGAALNKVLSDQAKTLQENEQLKKDLYLLNEKFQAELTTLQQENEQLKKDLQQLKNLEMQLEKRGKTLR